MLFNIRPTVVNAHVFHSCGIDLVGEKRPRNTAYNVSNCIAPIYFWKLFLGAHNILKLEHLTTCNIFKKHFPVQLAMKKNIFWS